MKAKDFLFSKYPLVSPEWFNENELTQEMIKMMEEYLAYFIDEMRNKLFNMRSTKDAMDKLSEADRLMMYGYHDCINEMLVWTKNMKGGNK